ncbi:MAG TPA: fused MFS/spermidine synthase [Phycisphaerae bacterium]|nr:fused MFS/spermidine synthase [Phycisphaerae bacterium]
MNREFSQEGAAAPTCLADAALPPVAAEWPGAVSTRPRTAHGGALVVSFTATLFVSALLLFLVQPMVGKMILPMFGGTPAVWNTCMVFFQAVLLAGYAYAHVTTVWLGVRRQAVIHLVLLLIPLAALPIAAASGPAPPAAANPAPWLLWRLLLTVGLPFFVVSTSGPLLQRWFAGTAHPSAGDPYFLYAASNAGSLLALLAYPLLIEPAFPLDAQAQVWTAGYVVLIVMAAGCAAAVWRTCSPALATTPRRPTGVAATVGIPHTALAVPTLRRRAHWVVLAFVPSSLMLGVTAHITTDLAAVPLLWVIPLALYLLTFVLVFAKRPPIPLAVNVRLLPFVMLPLALLTFLELRAAGWLLVPLHLFVFFVAAMVCHGRLAGSRPSAGHLTEFYLWMSVGGVLGGLFNAIIAPLIFATVVEYPLVMVLACMMMPRRGTAPDTARTKRLDVALPIALAVVAGAIMVGLQTAGITQGVFGRLFAFGVPAIICFSFKDRPLRFGLGFGVLLLTVSYYAGLEKGHRLHVERNFFGTKRVEVAAGGRLRVLVHGRTKHGIQSTDPARSDEPLAYYHRTGPVGDVFDGLSESRPTARVAIIGLGVGAIAAYAEPDQHFTFYEIDPGVARIAADTRYFTFLAHCRAPCDVVLGDGRLTLGDAPDRQYDLIILDAFSSDAIPTHLLTREAVELYLEKLADDGLLVFHISNRYLGLEPILGNLAREMDLVCAARADLAVRQDEQAEGKLPSHYAALARTAEDLGNLLDHPLWKRVPPDPNAPVWTDQYSNILGLFRWR